jgi:hypothetical protein
LDYPEDGEIVALMIGDLLLMIQRGLLLISSGETKKTNSVYLDDESIKFQQNVSNLLPFDKASYRERLNKSVTISNHALL